MLETVKYLLGSAGASGYGSKSTAEKVTEQTSDLRSVTAVITGKDFDGKKIVYENFYLPRYYF